MAFLNFYMVSQKFIKILFEIWIGAKILKWGNRGVTKIEQIYKKYEYIGQGRGYMINTIFFTKSQGAQNFSYWNWFLLKLCNSKKRIWGPSSYRNYFIFLVAYSLTSGEALIKIWAHLVSKKNCKVYLQNTGGSKTVFEQKSAVRQDLRKMAFLTLKSNP
jgi:hypothetical protein